MISHTHMFSFSSPWQDLGTILNQATTMLLEKWGGFCFPLLQSLNEND